MYGIEKLKEITTDTINFSMKLVEATSEDSPKGKKLALTEVVTLLVFLFPKVVGYADDGQQIKNEILDLDDAEAQELSDHVAEKLDLENDKVEVLIESALDLLAEGKAFISKVKDVVGNDN